MHQAGRQRHLEARWGMAERVIAVTRSGGGGGGWSANAEVEPEESVRAPLLPAPRSERGPAGHHASKRQGALLKELSNDYSERSRWFRGTQYPSQLKLAEAEDPVSR